MDKIQVIFLTVVGTFLLSFIILGIFIYNHFDELEIGGEDPSNKIEGA
jgi:hypothetical protein